MCMSSKKMYSKQRVNTVTSLKIAINNKDSGRIVANINLHQKNIN